MANKDRMQKYIWSKKTEFMNTSTSVALISTHDLTSEYLRTIRENFSNNITSENFVYMISTSIMSAGKTGVVFTDKGVYTKSWGIFTNCYYNTYANAQSANFGNTTEVNSSKLRETMKQLHEIICEEERQKSKGNKVEKFANFLEDVKETGELVVDLLNMFNDEAKKIDDTLKDALESISDTSTNDDTEIDVTNEIALKIYSLFKWDIDTTKKVLEFAEDQDFDDKQKSLFYEVSELFVEDLIKHISQIKSTAINNFDGAFGEIDSYVEFDYASGEIFFWALLFHPQCLFEKAYNEKPISDMPDLFYDFFTLLDELIYGEKYIIEKINRFGSNVVENLEKINELSDQDESREVKRTLKTLWNTIFGEIDELLELFTGICNCLAEKD